MAKETGVEANIPEVYRWDNLVNKSGIELKNFYKELLDKLGTNTTGRIREIYQGSATNIEEPKNLEKIIKTIDELDWYSAKSSASWIITTFACLWCYKLYNHINEYTRGKILPCSRFFLIGIFFE